MITNSLHFYGMMLDPDVTQNNSASIAMMLSEQKLDVVTQENYFFLKYMSKL